MTTQLVTTRTTSIANFGARDEIRELAERLRLMMPGGQKYTESEALTLAQISIAHDLDPFNGECWLIKDDKTGKVYGALIGIKGHRKHAKKQASYWGFGENGGFTRITDPKKLGEYKAPEGAIVFEYRIIDDATLKPYTDNFARLTDAGLPLEAAQKMMGPVPVTLGVGIWSPGEQTKMKPHQCAMFRAEKDALKRRFDVKFRVEIEGRIIDVRSNGDFEAELEVGEIEADYEEYLDDEPRGEDEILEELGFTPPESPGKPESDGNGGSGGRHWPNDLVKRLISEGLANASKHAVNILNLSPFVDDPDLDYNEVIEWARHRKD